MLWQSRSACARLWDVGLLKSKSSTLTSCKQAHDLRLHPANARIVCGHAKPSTIARCKAEACEPLCALEFNRDTMRSAVPCRISERRAAQSDFTPFGSSGVTRTIASCPL